jgi:hypothetical protein
LSKLLLLRAFIESSNGGYYSPIHQGLDCYTLLYIIDDPNKYSQIPDHLLPGNIVDDCTGYKLSFFYPIEYLDKPIHRDPRLDLGFYTGYYMPRGRLPVKNDKRLGRDDLLLFMAGLCRYDEDLWGRGYGLSYFKKVFRRVYRSGFCGIYIVGGIIVEDVIDVSIYGWRDIIGSYPFLKYSPHYYRVGDEPVAVIGSGFKLVKPLLIGFRRGVYSSYFEELIGRRDALMVSMNNFRRSRVIEIGDPYVFIDKILELVNNGLE